MKKLHDGTEVSDTTATKLVDGKRYLLTDTEKSEKATQDSAYEAKRAMLTWQKEIASTDKLVPRYVEDLIDALVSKNAIAKTDLPAVLKKNYEDKKALRTKKPRGD